MKLKATVLALILIGALTILSSCDKNETEVTETATNSVVTESETVVETDSNIPIMETIDETDMETADTKYIKALYNPKEWVLCEPNSLETLLLISNNTEIITPTSITFAFPDPLPLGISLTECSDLIKNAMDLMLDVEINVDEIRTLNGEEIMYKETVSKITDDTLDAYVLLGLMTEEEITSAGGRETLKQAPPLKQIIMLKVVDGKGYSVTATYGDDFIKDSAIEALTLIMQSMEIK